MWSARMLAQAEVPPTTTPRRWAAWIAAANGVPVMKLLSLSWLPPVMKMPVDPRRGRPQCLTVQGLGTVLGPDLDHVPGAQQTEDRPVHLDHLGSE